MPAAREAAPEDRQETCDLCGKPARVCVLHGYRDGAPVYGRYCLDCPSTSDFDHSARSRSSKRLSLHLLICLLGVVIGVLGGAADLVVSDAHPGFGWYQRTGVLVGAIIVLLGMLVRAEVVALVGVFLFAGAVSWDCFSYSDAPGVGWKQQTALVVSAFLLVLAVVLGVRSRIRLRRREV